MSRPPGARATVGGSEVEQARVLRLSTGALRGHHQLPRDVPRGGCAEILALGDRQYLAQVRRLAANARYVTSVCSGSLILAGAGLLAGKRAACHWSWRPLLAEHGVAVEEARIVRDGNVITGGGVMAGIDFALVLAAELAGVEVAQRIQLAIEYDPAPPFAAGSPERAPAAVVAALRERVALQYPERRAALAALKG